MPYIQYPTEGFIFYEDRSNPRTMEGPKHYHNVIELYFMETGSCNYFIDNKLYRVAEGDLVLIPEGTLHKTRYGNGERTRRLLHCSAEFVPEGVIGKIPLLYRNPSLVPKIRELIDAIRREFSSPDGYSKEVASSLLKLLFYTLVRHADTCLSAQPHNLYTEQLIAHINESYATDISLAGMAEQIAVSPEHLSRLFKKETGFGFCEYLTMVRLQKAETMLKSNPTMRISEVAFACGFNDSNYFSDKFKQIYGFPPGKLRKKH